MAESSPKPTYLVDAYADPAIIKIEGRASFLNCGCLRDFFKQMIADGKRRFLVDFLGCTGMDSTFLGVLAGVALELRRLAPPGRLVLCRLGTRNLELVRNLGLHRLMTVDAGDFALNFDQAARPLVCDEDRDEIERARLVLEAHESLVAAEPSNRGKFQDVIAFLKNRLEQP